MFELRGSSGVVLTIDPKTFGRVFPIAGNVRVRAIGLGARVGEGLVVAGTARADPGGGFEFEVEAGAGGGELGVGDGRGAFSGDGGAALAEAEEGARAGVGRGG